MTNLAHYRYLILAVISFLFFANLPVLATPVFAKFVIPPFHPHAIYWTTLGLGILTLLCMVCSPHRED
jgi:ABC-type bacteriocin/lantibiotic exporter with double-glycine peptidase domain